MFNIFIFYINMQNLFNNEKLYYKIYDFIAWRRIVFLVSFFLIFISCIVVPIKGFNLGLDFTGGVLVEVKIKKNIDVDTIKNFFLKSEFTKVIVQRFDVSQDFVIRLFSTRKNALVRENIIKILQENIMQEFTIKQINWIGPTVSNNLMKDGIIALLTGIICVVIYITVRFEWRLAMGTIFSLIQDTVIIIGILSFFSIEVDSMVIAALMSVIGYSLNDKIVIFDRIRENFFCTFRSHSVDILNVSISQVLHRTIITSVTTEIVLLTLLIFGGPILCGFSIILLIGVVIGTISSIYIASTLAFKLGLKHEHFIKINKSNEKIYY